MSNLLFIGFIVFGVWGFFDNVYNVDTVNIKYHPSNVTLLSVVYGVVAGCGVAGLIL